jgi:hypothetical protein
MKRNLLFVLAFVAMCFQVSAQDALPGAYSTSIKKTSMDIEVDGYPDDDVWSAAEEMAFPFTLQEDFIAETDFSATVKLAWKEGLGLYIYITAIDDMEHFLEEGGTTYNRDNVEYFFYWGSEGDWGPETEVTAVENDTLYNQLRLQLKDDYTTAHDGRFKGAWASAPLGAAADGNLEAVANATGSGWDIEAIFPFAMFAMKEEAVDDLMFGFDISIGDADEADRDFQLTLMNDSKADLAWNNKAYLNTGILSGTYLTSIEDARVANVAVYPTLVNDVINLRGEVSNVAIYNTVGQVVMSIEDVNSTTINVSELKSGIYFVDVDGQTTKIVKK